jgi:hypothetical protein
MATVTERALVGTWRLVSFHVKTSDGKMTYPYGADAVGYYLFSDSGHMAVSVMAAARPKFASGDVLGGTTEEKVKAAETFISYSGPYRLEGDRLIVHPELAFFPNWVGVDQIRIASLEGDELNLSTPPMLISGLQQTAHLVWQRVRG